jgi:predicted GNAT superfamily acetyltransferase
VTTDVEIRPLIGIDEYRACVALQEATWGEGFSERVPTAILKVSQLLGGVASGAWSADGRLQGFVFGMTGVRGGEVVHWSDMLAVRAEMRGRGIGRALKLHQREVLLGRGIRTMLWTFDPLRARNAHLNFTKLGIVAADYRQDMYGETDSPLHRGVGTDRLIALWLMDSPRVVARIRASEATGELPPGLAHATARRSHDDAAPAIVDREPGSLDPPRPTRPDLGRSERLLRIVVPPDIGRLIEENPALARSWRDATREAFDFYLSRGWEVREFVRDAEAPAYILEQPEEST